MGLPVYDALARASRVPLDIDTIEHIAGNDGPIGNSMHVANVGVVMLAAIFCSRMAVADAAGPDLWSTSWKIVPTPSWRILVTDCMLRLADPLAEDCGDGLHASTRRHLRRGVLRNATRMHCGSVLVR